MITGLIWCLCARVTTDRSARRQTVRATWSAAAFGAPPDRMKFFSGFSFGSYESMTRSRALTVSASSDVRSFAAFGVEL